MSLNNPDFRCGRDVLEYDKNKTLSYTNSCIKDAWGQFGKTFKNENVTHVKILLLMVMLSFEKGEAIDYLGELRKRANGSGN